MILKKIASHIFSNEKSTIYILLVLFNPKKIIFENH